MTPLTDTLDRGKAVPLREAAVARLRDMIVSGDLPAGERLNERILCELLHVSRTPLRDAFKILENEGLVSLLPNRGAWVTRMSRKEAADTIFVLANLEAMAGDATCANITDDQIQRLTELQRELEICHADGRLMDYAKIDHLFHLSILEATGNQPLQATWHPLSVRARRFRYAINRSQLRWDEAVKEHQFILHAIQGRKSEVLGVLLRSHVLAGWDGTSDWPDLED